MTGTETDRRVVIAGASGFIGRHLARAFRADGRTVSLIGRAESIGATDSAATDSAGTDGAGTDRAAWGDHAAITRVLDGADLLINLAGKSVNCRYTPANRAEILRSRVDTTRQLSAALLDCDAPPPLWVNSSTATIYRHADDRPMTESDGEIGTGFSVGIATDWEAALFRDDLPGTRRVALRMAIVLGDGSALVPLIRLARFGLGGPQLDGRWFPTAARRQAGTYHETATPQGRQRFSWIHIDDVLGIIRFLETRPDISGVVNASAPHPADSRTLMSTLRRVLGVPFGLPAPRWVLELGAAVIRTETELVLKSRWVLPERMLQAGYRFTHPDLEPALADITAGRGLPAAPRKR